MTKIATATSVCAGQQIGQRGGGGSWSHADQLRASIERLQSTSQESGDVVEADATEPSHRFFLLTRFGNDDDRLLVVENRAAPSRILALERDVERPSQMRTLKIGGVTDMLPKLVRMAFFTRPLPTMMLLARIGTSVASTVAVRNQDRLLKADTYVVRGARRVRLCSDDEAKRAHMPTKDELLAKA